MTGPGVAAGVPFLRAMVVAGAGLVPLIWSMVCTATAIPWNSARLAPAFALAYGDVLYPPRDVGAQLGWFYGPMFPVVHMPLAILDSPAVAVASAALINLAVLVAPALVLVRRVLHAPWRTVAATGIVLLAVLLGSPTLRWWFYFVHVDALCVGFGMMGCIGLHLAVTNDEVRGLQIASLAVVLALWTKQIAVMMGPAMVIWLWREGHRQMLRDFIIWCALHFAAVTLVLFFLFGAEELVLDTIIIHMRTPLQAGVWPWLRSLGAVAVCFWTALPLVACGVVAFRRWRRAGEAVISPEVASVIRLLLWMALLQLPLGLLASVKTGGGVNSVHSLYYVCIAGLLFVGNALHRPAIGANGRWCAGRMWGVALLFPVAVGLGLAFRAGVSWTMFWEHDELVAKVRAAPGKYYLPWDPLATLIGEKRIQPFDDALYCFWLAGLELSPETVRAAVPEHPVILYSEPAQSKFALRYFPEVKRGP